MLKGGSSHRHVFSWERIPFATFGSGQGQAFNLMISFSHLAKLVLSLHAIKSSLNEAHIHPPRFLAMLDFIFSAGFCESITISPLSLCSHR